MQTFMTKDSGVMKLRKRRLIAIATTSVFLSGCAGVMTKNQSALVGATTCGALGAMGGAAAAHQGIDGKHRNEAMGAGIGAVAGALICGGLAYLMPRPGIQEVQRHLDFPLSRDDV